MISPIDIIMNKPGIRPFDKSEEVARYEMEVQGICVMKEASDPTSRRILMVISGDALLPYSQLLISNISTVGGYRATPIHSYYSIWYMK